MRVAIIPVTVSYTHLRAHETVLDLVCRLLLEKKCRWTGGQWEELGMNWNDIQSVPRHIRMLSDYLVQIDYVASGGKN